MKICFGINLCHGSYLIWSLQMTLCRLWNQAVRIVQSFRSVALRPCLSSAFTSELPASCCCSTVTRLFWINLQGHHDPSKRTRDTLPCFCVLFPDSPSFFICLTFRVTATTRGKCSSFFKSRLTFRLHEPFVCIKSKWRPGVQPFCVTAAFWLPLLHPLGHCSMPFWSSWRGKYEMSVAQKQEKWRWTE